MICKILDHLPPPPTGGHHCHLQNHSLLFMINWKGEILYLDMYPVPRLSSCHHYSVLCTYWGNMSVTASCVRILQNSYCQISPWKVSDNCLIWNKRNYIMGGKFISSHFKIFFSHVGGSDPSFFYGFSKIIFFFNF